MNWYTSSAFTDVFNTKVKGQLHWLYSELEDQQFAPLYILYSGAKHFPLFSQRPFHISGYSILKEYTIMLLMMQQ